MAIFYFKIHIISRNKGGSAISAAAYRACQELYNPYDGRISDYTHKAGNVYSQILSLIILLIIYLIAKNYGVA